MRIFCSIVLFANLRYTLPASVSNKIFDPPIIVSLSVRGSIPGSAVDTPTPNSPEKSFPHE
jgi:hypothetical protein